MDQTLNTAAYWNKGEACVWVIVQKKFLGIII